MEVEKDFQFDKALYDELRTRRDFGFEQVRARSRRLGRFHLTTILIVIVIVIEVVGSDGCTVYNIPVSCALESDIYVALENKAPTIILVLY